MTFVVGDYQRRRATAAKRVEGSCRVVWGGDMGDKKKIEYKMSLP